MGKMSSQLVVMYSGKVECITHHAVHGTIFQCNSACRWMKCHGRKRKKPKWQALICPAVFGAASDNASAYWVMDGHGISMGPPMKDREANEPGYIDG